MLTLIERAAPGLVAISTDSCDPPVSAVTAYGPPGTDSDASPPPVSTRTDAGAVMNPSVTPPPSPLTAAEGEVRLVADSGPPPVSTFSVPVTSLGLDPAALGGHAERAAGSCSR